MPLDTRYSLDQTLRLLSIPSPSGYPRQVCDALMETLEGLGFSPRQLRKGGVVCPLGGEGRPLVLAAHVDTLGLMVRAIKPDGRLAFTCLGGPSLQAVETENVTVITRGGRHYTGVVELRNASKHVNRATWTAKNATTRRWRSSWTRRLPPARTWSGWASPWAISSASIPAPA